MYIRCCHIIDSLFYSYKGIPAPSCTGLEHLNEALRLNKGVIVLVPHYGCYGSVAYGLMCKGYKLSQFLTLYPQNIYRRNDWIDSQVVKAKARCWSHPNVQNIYYRPGHSVRQIYRVLKENGIIIMYPDGSRGSKMDLFEFLGNKIRFSTGFAEIALRTGAVILPAFSATDENGFHTINIEPCIHTDDNNSIRKPISAYLKILEHYIEKDPAQWHTWLRIIKTGAGTFETITKEVEADKFYLPSDM